MGSKKGVVFSLSEGRFQFGGSLEGNLELLASC